MNLPEEKILQLLYSGEPANDLLAFEMIKQLGNRTSYKIPLISLLVSEIDASLKKEVYEYLEPTLNEKQRDFLEFFPIPRFYKIITGYLSKRKLSAYDDFKVYFSLDEFSSVLYATAKRGTYSPSIYLALTTKEYSKREEMVDLLFHKLDLKDIAFHRGRISFNKLDISVLYPDEMDRLVKKNIQQYSPINPHFYFTFEFDLNFLKSSELPSIIFNLKRIQLIISKTEDFSIKSFPKFLLRFKNIEQLTMLVSYHFDTHFDWSQSNGMERLILNYVNVCRISDFTFLTSIPKLKSAEFKSRKFRFSHPEILLEIIHTNIRIQFSCKGNFDSPLEFESTEGYPIHPKLQVTWLEAVTALGNSNLSYQQKANYFKQLSLYENPNDMSILSLDEIKELVAGRAISLWKDSSNQIIASWTTANSTGYGERHIEVFIKQYNDK